MKKLLVILLALVFFFLSASQVFAQRQFGVMESIYLGGVKGLLGCSDEMKGTLDGEMALEQWVGGTCSGGGVEGAQTSVQGAVPLAANLISKMVENRPVSSVTYLADVSQNLGFAKPAYAQGTGFKALEPILAVWKAFRNVAYLLMVIVMVVVGFMIMFRKQINPQTVVSIQNALPNIVVTLLLITFSYAIAALLIDLIYVAIYLIVGIFTFSGVITDGGPALQMLLNRGLFSLVYAGGNIFTRAPAMAVEDLVNGLLGGGWLADILSGSMEILFMVILAIALAFAMFKLFFILLLSYLGIVLSVIFAPLQLLFNAIPGSNSFMGWLKNLLANVVVFPAVAGMFLLTAILIGAVEPGACGPDTQNPWCVSEDLGFAGQRGEPGWAPPFIGGGIGTTNAFQGLIALGMIMMMPQIAQRIKQMLQIEAQPGVGAAIVGGVMVGPRVAGAGLAMPARLLGTYYTAGQGLAAAAPGLAARLPLFRKFVRPAERTTPTS